MSAAVPLLPPMTVRESATGYQGQAESVSADGRLLVQFAVRREWVSAHALSDVDSTRLGVAIRAARTATAKKPTEPLQED